MKITIQLNHGEKNNQEVLTQTFDLPDDFLKKFGNNQTILKKFIALVFQISDTSLLTYLVVDLKESKIKITLSSEATQTSKIWPQNIKLPSNAVINLADFLQQEKLQKKALSLFEAWIDDFDSSRLFQLWIKHFGEEFENGCRKFLTTKPNLLIVYALITQDIKTIPLEKLEEILPAFENYHTIHTSLTRTLHALKKNEDELRAEPEDQCYYFNFNQMDTSAFEDLQDFQFQYGVFYKVDFSNKELDDASLEYAVLDEANFTSSGLRGVNFRDAVINNCKGASIHLPKESKVSLLSNFESDDSSSEEEILPYLPTYNQK